MENQEPEENKSRVIKVESEESWDFYISQATTQGCPVSILSPSSSSTSQFSFSLFHIVSVSAVLILIN